MRKAGRTHARWSTERLVSSHGYVKIRVGRDHPLADSKGYAYEHLIVWRSAGHPPPTEDEILHHINHDKADNRIGNLALVARAEHARYHATQRTRAANGTFRAMAA